MSTPDQWATSARLEGLDPSGMWRELAGQPSLSSAPITDSLRLDAIAELRRRGFHYLLVDAGNFGAEDFRRNRSLWGLRLVDERAGARLYKID